MTETQRQDATTDEQARRWVVVMAASEPGGETRRAFDRWLASDPRNDAAYADALRVWNALDQIPALREAARFSDLSRFAADRQTSEIGRPASRRIRSPLFLGGIAAALFAVVVTALISFGIADWRSTGYVTKVAEIRDIRLDDGSIVTLGARSEIEVRYTDTERRVKLLAGEAFFAVAKNPGRPFYVTADDTRVRVVGTQFEVHRGVGQVRVAVAEGRVEVATGIKRQFFESQRSDEQATVLMPGQEILTTRNRDGSALRAVAGSGPPAAWREGRLYYEGAPLVDVVADINRYYHGRVDLESPQIGALRITGSFRTDRIDQLLANMQQILPIVAEHDGPDVVILKSRQ